MPYLGLPAIFSFLSRSIGALFLVRMRFVLIKRKLLVFKSFSGVFRQFTWVYPHESKNINIKG